MQLHDFCDRVLEEIRENQEDLGKPVLLGNLPTFDRYQFQVGKIAGLRVAEAIIKGTLDNIYETRKSQP